MIIINIIHILCKYCEYKKNKDFILYHIIIFFHYIPKNNTKYHVNQIGDIYFYNE